MAQTIPIPDQQVLQPICERHGVRRLAIFGSAAIGEVEAVSDVDLLVDFRGDRTPTYLELASLGDELSELFGGRYVDLVMPRNLHWFVREEVLASARSIYEG